MDDSPKGEEKNPCLWRDESAANIEQMCGPRVEERKSGREEREVSERVSERTCGMANSNHDEAVDMRVCDNSGQNSRGVE